MVAAGAGPSTRTPRAGGDGPSTVPNNLLFATNISVEYQPSGSTPGHAPLVDVACPRFSWQLGSSNPGARDQVQQGYELVVRELLPDGSEQHVSDSYQVWSNESINVALGCYTSAYGCNGATTLWESWSGMPDISLHQP
eukprot:COSAG06_NODE_29297_length_559_cov_0.789130_1_plen_138_part_10